MSRKTRAQQAQLAALHQTSTATVQEPFIVARVMTRTVAVTGTAVDTGINTRAVATPTVTVASPKSTGTTILRSVNIGGGSSYGHDDTVRADTIKIRRDTIVNWETNANVILEEGEIGLIMPKTQSLNQIEPLKCKIGDGIHTWAELPQQSWVSTAGIMPMESASGMLSIYDDSGSVIPSSQSLADMVQTILGLENSVYTVDLRLDTIDHGRTYEYNTGGPVTICWSSSRFDTPKVPSQVVYYRTGSRPEDNYEWPPVTPELAHGQFTDTYTPLGEITYGVRATVDSVETKTELGLDWVLPCYLGFAESGSTVADMTGSLIKIVTRNIGTNAKVTYELENSSGQAEYLTMCLPASMSFYQVRSNGIMVPLQDPEADTSITVGGTAQSYNIYRSANLIVTGSLPLDVYTVE